MIKVKNVLVLLFSVFLLASCSSNKSSENAIDEGQIELIKDVQASVSENFYYQQLSDVEKENYARLRLAFNDFSDEVTLKEVDAESLAKISTAFTNDNPDVFWFNDYTYQTDGNDQLILEIETPDDVEEIYQLIEVMSEQILAEMPTDSDYSRVKYLYEFIINYTDYNTLALTDDSELDKGQDIRSVFIDQLSVCSGYSKAFQYLANKAGIPTTYIVGFARSDKTEESELPHAWNTVIINGQSYNVDTTWGDPIFEGEMSEDMSDTINYHFLCVPDYLFNNSHTASDDILFQDGSSIDDVWTLPTSTDNSLNYYVQAGCFFESYQRSEMESYVEQLSHSENLKQIELVFENQESYDLALNDLLEEGFFGELIQKYILGDIDFEYNFIYDDVNYYICINIPGR